MKDGIVQAEPGSGQFLAREPVRPDQTDRQRAVRLRCQRVPGLNTEEDP